MIDSVLVLSLEQNSSLTVSVSWPTEGLAGEHVIYVDVDADSLIRDINRDNNFAFRTVEVETKTDLFITPEDISFDPTDPVDGDTVLISATVHNSTGDDGLPLSDVNPMKSIVKTSFGKDSPDVPGGPKRSKYLQREIEKDGNALNGSFDSGPDAIVRSVVGSIPMTLSLADSFYVRFYDGFPDSSGILIDSALVRSLEEDSSITVSVSWPTDGLAGGHVIYVDVDADSLIRDIDRDNNYAFRVLSIAACDYIPGDCNHNGSALELADVIAMIGMYRGSVDPYYICDCGVDPPGAEFAATADPNGNCIAMELADVVTEIAAYRGTDTAAGCPDCPGSLRLIPGDEDQPMIMPSLKAKVKAGGSSKVE